jgi:acyl-CoA thioester hydrolase
MVEANAGPHTGYFRGAAHILPLRVYYEDTDAAGIVYYANYLRFMERGRSDMLRLLDIPVAGVDIFDGNNPSSTLFVVRRCEVEYLRPARLNDGLEVCTSLVHLGGASITMAQSVSRDGTDLVDALIKVACVAADGRPKRMPPQVRTTLRQLTLENEGNLRNAG